jgi:hypothetical protein
MESDREQLARAVVDAWNRHDEDRLVELFHPDCEIHAPLALGDEPYRGH